MLPRQGTRSILPSVVDGEGQVSARAIVLASRTACGPNPDPSAACFKFMASLQHEQEDPEPRNSVAYIGLGVTCPYLIGYATSTSLICVGPGSDSAKNSYAHAHIGSLPIFMGVV
ncbi:hypothetical protein EWB00_001793 [Schistosoma japonicum]|uniref:Uncharacterized protein n=1 Tax=Schistosoma japonicum TaxID=6182 RepID=A0A4Z2CK19_SCHJA|nr:hypothetical protein EWB00_001793 [Schistosoma japonicum]